MSNCTDLSITFSSKNKDVLETLRPQLIEFYEYDGRDNYRELYKTLMGDKDPKTGKRITDKRLTELMEYIGYQMDVDDVWEDKNGDFLISIGDSGYTDDEFWILVADKYNVDLEITCVCSMGTEGADKTSYIDRVYRYHSVELTDDEKLKTIKDSCDEDEKLLSDKELLDIAYDFTDELREALYEKLYRAGRTSFTIDCENNYLDNLKSFVDSNNDIPKLDEHLVKSGLFKTAIGTEKRRRIEVEINGVKLYADSKPAVKQRKSNVEKLKKLLA